MNWKIKLLPDKSIEVWSTSEESGPIIYILPAGEISLWEIPQYGGEERFIAEFLTLAEAMEAGNLLT